MSIVVENVSYRYPQARINALTEVTVTIDKGETIGIIGSSGAGKSTFCYLLNGAIPLSFGGAFNGQVIVGGQLTTSHRLGSLAKTVGLLFQDPSAQISSVTVEEELAFGLENFTTPREEIHARIDSVINELQITHLRYRPMAQLSEGEKQLVLLGAILVMEPEVLVLDEPFTMIDPRARLRLVESLRRLQDQGITIVVTEHNFELLMTLVERVLAFAGGRIVTEGTPWEVFSNRESLASLKLEVPRSVEMLQRIQELAPTEKMCQRAEEWFRDRLDS